MIPPKTSKINHLPLLQSVSFFDCFCFGACSKISCNGSFQEVLFLPVHSLFCGEFLWGLFLDGCGVRGESFGSFVVGLSCFFDRHWFSSSLIDYLGCSGDEDDAYGSNWSNGSLHYCFLLSFFGLCLTTWVVNNVLYHWELITCYIVCSVLAVLSSFGSQLFNRFFLR